MLLKCIYQIDSNIINYIKLLVVVDIKYLSTLHPRINS